MITVDGKCGTRLKRLRFVGGSHRGHSGRPTHHGVPSVQPERTALFAVRFVHIELLWRSLIALALTESRPDRPSRRRASHIYTAWDFALSARIQLGLKSLLK